ncbi:MAG: ABC transporter permease [Deltaproteobacteria bacterium]|nr:ABC transporter permease [Deltaproteobacteria bacterium]
MMNKTGTKTMFVIKLAGPGLAVLGALVIGAVIIKLSGYDPLNAYWELLKGGWGNKSALANTLRLTTPLLLTALSFMIAFKAGMINLGADGQLYMGAFAAAVVGFALPSLPAPLHIALCLVSAALMGMIWVIIPTICRLRFGASEILTTLMMNYIAILFTEYLVTYPFRGGGVTGQAIATKPILESAILPSIIPPYRVTPALAIAVCLAIILYLIFKRTVLGYEIKMVGQNPEFARYTGIAVGRTMFKAMFISGGLAGLAGAVEVLGVHLKFMTHFSQNAGFDGIIISLLGKNHPLCILVSSIFIGGLKNGAMAMERRTDIDQNVIIIMTAIIILFVTALEFKRQRHRED